MLRRDRLIRMQVHELMDACLFAVSFWLAYVVRSDPRVIELFRLDDVSPFEAYVWLYLILIPAGPLILEAQGFYNRPILCSRVVTSWLLFKGCLFTTLGLILTLFLFHSGIARLVTVLFGGISFVLLFAKEEVLRRAFRSELAREQYRRRFLLVGSSEETGRIRAELRNKSPEAMHVIAELDLNTASVERLVELLHEHSVNGVIISAKKSFFDQIETAVRACELEGVEVWLMADFFKTQISRTTFDDFYGQAIMVFRAVPEASWASVAKQLIDFFGAAALLLILSVPLTVVALLVKLTSRGPIFFRQQRSGLNGRPFTLFKFRTMISNAEQLKHELAAMNEMSGPVFKLVNDPRITPMG